MSLLSGFFGNNGPQLVEVDSGAVLVVSEEMELSHAELAEVAGVTGEVSDGEELTICSC